jgi:hypothetical protein
VLLFPATGTFLQVWLASNDNTRHSLLVAGFHNVFELTTPELHESRLFGILRSSFSLLAHHGCFSTLLPALLDSSLFKMAFAWAWLKLLIVSLAVFLNFPRAAVEPTFEESCSALVSKVDLPNVQAQFAEYVSRGTNLTFPYDVCRSSTDFHTWFPYQSLLIRT